MRARSWQHRLEPHVRRTFGTYEATAGVMGVLAIIDRAPSHIARLPESVHKQVAVLFTLMGLVFVVVVVAGVLLFRGKRGGWPLTTVLQVAQVPLWSNASSSYIFFAGLLGGVAWNPDGVRQFIGFQANMQLAWSTVPGRAVYFGVNVVPLLVLGVGWLTRRVPEQSGEVLSLVGQNAGDSEIPKTL